MHRSSLAPVAGAVLVLISLSAGLDAAEIAFPDRRPERWSYARPRRGEVFAHVTPPGFCWWRAAPRGKARYRLRVTRSGGTEAYTSALLGDPVCVPERALPAGEYSWTVDAVDAAEKVVDTWPARTFTVAEGARAQPWVDPVELLRRVPREHPRLLFPRATLGEVRATLDTTRREAYESLRGGARRALRMEAPPEPDYDEIEDRAKRRLAYFDSFHEMRRYHLQGMLPAAMVYLLSGEKEYGESARRLLLGAAAWDPEGISSVMAPHGDEVGLGIVKSAALTYDWIHDLLTPEERERVERMLAARADQMLRRLERLDFLNRPESSHDGRLPGYLIEHAIALSEHPRARVWLDYGLRAILTVFPHWAGRDGGWAEGLLYGMAYNGIFITPLESLRRATGFDVWQRTFYRRLPWFFVYHVAPRGEIMGFGDSYDGPATGRASGLRGLVQFHAERTRDPVLRGWVDLLADSRGRRPGLPAIPGILLPQEVPAAPLPDDLPLDAAFTGVGWAALHTSLASPESDLLVAFKSSPFGSVSHSYADQNGFSILKGGRALARPGGSRYPHHGTPFHSRYTQQTVAQNSILVNGRGQTARSGSASGEIVAFESRRSFGYVCGDASRAYGGRLTRFRRHVLLVRPSLVCIVDDLEAPEAAELQWLMHAPERLDLREEDGTFTSRRGDASMDVHLLTPGGVTLSQTDEWPLAPKTGYPTATRREPPKLWHLTATTRERTRSHRIAAIFLVRGPGESPECRVTRGDGDIVRVETEGTGGPARVDIRLSPESPGEALMSVEARAAAGAVESLSAK